MPSGLVITCGPTATVRSWDPATGIWNILTQTSSYRDYGTSFLLPLNNSASERGKILIVGGNRTSTEPTLNSVEIIDFNAGSSTNPVVRSVASISQARKFLLPIILPNGKLLFLEDLIQELALTLIHQKCLIQSVRLGLVCPRRRTKRVSWSSIVIA